MTPDEYLEAITRLDLNQTTSAKFLGVADRSVRRWIAGHAAIPYGVTLLLRLAIRKKLSVEEIESVCKKPII